MELITAANSRLEGSVDLAEIMTAACDAFGLILIALENQRDPAGGAYADLVMAAAYAANGRDALLFAPSLRALSAQQTAPATSSTLDLLVALTGLCRLIADRLNEATALAADHADARACTGAQRQADRLAALFAELTGP